MTQTVTATPFSLWRHYDAATTGLLALSGAAMFGIAIVNALLRYLFDAPLIWAEEIARYAMVWGTMIGVALAYRGGMHVAVTLLVDMIPEKTQLMLRLACHVISLAVAILIFRSGHILGGMLGGLQGPSSGIAMVWIYSAIPVGAAMLLIEILRRLWADLRLLRRGTASRGVAS
ncbi:TRAP transporter small permease [Ferrovibrio sp.]|uniref:TRAP transporter small permease n=1 Tax=Ferrovibrio sp. TaxID=1917215 RepID=UPI002637192A|nr:TRAP transporter small permease [Ferrovibrio sp.]